MQPLRGRDIAVVYHTISHQHPRYISRFPSRTFGNKDSRTRQKSDTEFLVGGPDIIRPQPAVVSSVAHITGFGLTVKYHLLPGAWNTRLRAELSRQGVCTTGLSLGILGVKGEAGVDGMTVRKRVPTSCCVTIEPKCAGTSHCKTGSLMKTGLEEP
ncbi:hypothetical protein GQ43DRAFT_444797 [Delitschia confertaspora ATCC 74209]|uniref:Uncharacterized protein n=1 Tax=Delitschia confertaspora ATCC 74209 TaxID=1513339 RepID=A0A9P4JHV9_9PLEO|nr:hypothetical protein GQ43DRAFT_444797 [Delitschia confertaspora ATCC 74209]